MPRIHFHTLGCRLNQAESERMARGFRLAGHEIVENPDEADIRVVNTCTVTAGAGIDSRKAARPGPREGQRVVVTGCHSEMRPEDFEGADLRVANDEKEELATRVIERFGLEGLALGMEAQGTEADSIYPLSLGHTRAFVKIQDGCNQRCSFCLTTLARGLSRSRPASEIITEIQQLADQGCQEVVLTGVHAGSYGEDIDQDLGGLIEQILHQTSLPRLRLSSLEPWNFKADWCELWERYGQRLCRHLHMSLQSGSQAVLRRMRRNYDPETFREKIDAARCIPGMAISTDIIVGFPGETEQEHRESLDFVESIALADAHIFSYSSRPGTDAARMPGHLDRKVKKERYDAMRQITEASRAAFLKTHVGQTLPVLWERRSRDGLLSGLTDNYIRAQVDVEEGLPNCITPFRVMRIENGRVVGHTVDDRDPFPP